MKTLQDTVDKYINHMENTFIKENLINQINNNSKYELNNELQHSIDNFKRVCKQINLSKKI